jgi:hypothetical protein
VLETQKGRKNKDRKDEFRSGAFVMTFFAAIFVNMEFCFAKPGDSKVGVDKS